MASIGAPTSAITLHFCDVEAGRGDDAHAWEAGPVELLADVEDGGGGDAGAGQIAQLGVVAVAADGERHVPLQHGVGVLRIEALDEAAAVGIEPHRQPAGGGQLGEAAADGQRVA